MKLLSIVLLLHVTKVKLHAINGYHQPNTYRIGMWKPPYWWRRTYQPAHHPVQAPMVVAPYVITVTKQQALPTSTTERPSDKNMSQRSTSAEPILVTNATATPSTTDLAGTISGTPVTATDDTVNGTVETATTSFNNNQQNFTGSFTNQTDILLKCEKLRPRALREACARVAKNPILDGQEGVRGYVGDEELNVGSFITARGLVVRQPLGRQLFCEGPDTCPNLDINNLPSLRNLRTTSPWVICQEYDPNRFPQWLNTAQCLCDGCIDLRTGRENGGSVVSQPLTVDVTVIRKSAIGRKFSECNTRICSEEIQSIGIGCHCAIANFRINAQIPA